jgi:hypothetical protein
MPGLDQPTDPPAKVAAGERPGRLTLTSAGDSGTDVLAEFAVGDLVAGDRERRRHRIRFSWTTRGESYSDDVTGLDLTAAGKILYRRGLRFYVVHTDRDDYLRLGVVINPVTPRRIAGRLMRKLRQRRAR